MAYVVLFVSIILLLAAATAIRPGRSGFFAIFAHPVGWAAGELAGQSLFVEGALLVVLWWWGWPSTTWLSVLVWMVASLATLMNLTLIGILFHSRTVVRRAMLDAPDRPLAIPRPRDDRFGSWWRTALQLSFHPRDMTLEKDIPYGPLDRHRLDVWRLETTPPEAPVIFYLHGGAWTFGDKRQQGRPMLHEFVRRGWIVVACNYRLAPAFPWPAQIEDATRALGWIKENITYHGGDADRVVVAGGSAGGHLASLLALSANDETWRPSDMPDVNDWTVRGAISFYGVLEMTGDESLWRGMGKGLKHLLENRVVQRPFVGNEDLYEALSPLSRIAADAPPFLVLQGTNDTLVEMHVARGFVEKFRSIAFAPIYYVELPFTQHAFDVTASPRTSATTRASVAFAESVVRIRREYDPALLANYQAPPTLLEVEVSSEQWVDGETAVKEIGPYFAATSDNPYSLKFSETENEERRRELHEFLLRRGIPFFATRTRDAEGAWPDEPGVAVTTLSRDETRALANSWDQLAIYEVTTEGTAVIDVRSNELLV